MPRTTPCLVSLVRVTPTGLALCSIFLLKSCEGFRQPGVNLWCCNSVLCNREFTSDFLLQVGVIREPLENLTCVEVGDVTVQPAPPGGVPVRGGGRVRGGDTGILDNGGMLLGVA